MRPSCRLLLGVLSAVASQASAERIDDPLSAVYIDPSLPSHNASVRTAAQFFLAADDWQLACSLPATGDATALCDAPIGRAPDDAAPMSLRDAVSSLLPDGWYLHAFPSARIVAFSRVAPIAATPASPALPEPTATLVLAPIALRPIIRDALPIPAIALELDLSVEPSASVVPLSTAAVETVTVTTIELQAGTFLRPSLQSAAAAHGYTLHWRSAVDFPIAYAARFEGADLRAAIDSALAATRSSSHPLAVDERPHRTLIVSAQ